MMDILTGEKKMPIVSRILQGQGKVAVVGLGYVGLPLAVAFADKVETVGFDINEEKVALYRSGIDPTGEVGNEKIKQTKLHFCSDKNCLQKADVIIVAVPTPVNGDKTPNLHPIISACEIVGANMSNNSIIVFESTVYPGVTEDLCIPILEKLSGLFCGADFKVGYSPERINPGDKVNRLNTIMKIVSGIDEETVEELAALYGSIVDAGVYRASSIKVAEAAKLVENAQRDINIAFMNELALAFDRMGIDTIEVVNAMNTKWNALKFTPGLVGGHCIGVDPYYFIYQAEMLGYHSQIIAAGRQVNDRMGSYVADAVVKKMILAKQDVSNAQIYVMGLTFKENVPDMRNSKSLDVIRQLATYGLKVKIVDPLVDKKELAEELDQELTELTEVKEADCLVFLVAHNCFVSLNPEEISRMYRSTGRGSSVPVLIDVKNIFDKKQMEKAGYLYWSL
jgi:UDP-N-acetyl-D-galactosamine dehydrogenase